MNIGIRGHDFGKLPLEDLISKIKEKGFNSLQLALSKVLDGVNTDLGTLNPGMAYFIGESFRKNDIQVAVIGCYINPIAANEEELKYGIERFKEHLRYARSFGCSIVATETGWPQSASDSEEENFNKLVSAVKELVSEAEKFGVFVGIEPVASHTISSPEKMKKLIDIINSNNLQVVFDPVNLLNIENYKNQDEIIKQSFELFGDRIVAVHCKDFIIENNTYKIVPAGTGMLNYKLIIDLLNSKKPYINLLLEDIEEKDMENSKMFLRNMRLKS